MSVENPFPISIENVSRRYRGLGNERLVVSNCSVSLEATGGTQAHFFISGADVHWTQDSKAATTSDFLLKSGTYLDFDDAEYDFSKFRFIRAGSVDAVIYVTYWELL